MDKRETRWTKRDSINELKEYAKMEFVDHVEILCGSDSCEICKVVADKKYPLKHLKQVPLIPIDGCTHERGCICCYTPLVDDLSQ